ncbi:uncharacterized protein KY384_002574 [Bacidia gigantensis]|uniref:uncharacterized protein n=1 Tax=Bacidia gigantensis TaxID=2732470 RepID=UPI001D05016C|nr:uncharacterized protein KY384_002574 [Bacidia gigantensis]KAG8532697.1 hypothetical protein KY384_002574 [Bacidia gigantensis]
MTRSEMHGPQRVSPNDGVRPSNRQNANHPNGSPTRRGNFHGGHGHFMHIKDLQSLAQESHQRYEAHLTARKLLDAAEGALKKVDTDVSFKRPDRAYVEWLVGSEIILHIIPKHLERHAAIDSDKDRAGFSRRYSDLRKRVDSQCDMITEIYNKIVEDNVQSGVQPQDTINSGNVNSQRRGINERPDQSPRPLSMPESPVANGSRNDELFLQESRRLISASTKRSPSPRSKPIVKPKPQNLRIHTSQVADAMRPGFRNGDDIAERFSQLRVQRPSALDTVPHGGYKRDSVGASSSSPESTPPTSDTSARSNATISSDGGVPTFSMKPLGPRSMPTASMTPAIPPKIPLSPLHNEQFQPLPQPPKPAYDPSKTAMLSNNTTKPSLNRKASIIGIEERNSRSPQRHSGHQTLANGIVLPARSSSMQPPQTTISATELYKQFQKSNVLVIDVRTREVFDSGHIFAKNIICVEPVGMTHGMSAEELEERLVNSPSAELTLFGKRHEFDLVVYYDQRTSTDAFLVGPPSRTEATHLRTLHDTLFEFDDYKPLRKRPLVLSGGLDAWVDLLGSHSLETSRTTAITQSKSLQSSSRKPARPIGRVPPASANSSLEVRRRRLKEQKTLNADEERRWLEKAQNEEVNPADYQADQSDSEIDQQGEEPPSPFVHSYEDFLRRFPEPASAHPHSYPPPPPPIIQARSQDSLESLPSVPSRPAPAIPRPSYSGVSNRESTLYSPISRQTSATQQPLYTSRSVSHYRKLPRTGLVNFGVTCYMNATIQCLLATIPLSQFFLSDRWRDLTVKNWKGSNGILPSHFANLIRSLWKDEDRAIRPGSLRNFCGRLKDDWGIDRQQDAKEFFDFLVDCLHEDLNQRFNRTPLDTLSEQQERIRESLPFRKAAKMEWERYAHREYSYIADLFAGQHASRIRCTTCNSTSTTFEAFYSISVEIPRSSLRRGSLSLHDCLKSYCQEEKLSGDEVWKCPHCKKEREATKKITITRAPQFLVVHFKRFEMRKGDAKKVHTPIDFPLHGLDLGNYMARDDASVRNQPNESMDIAMTPPYIYDCYAVMRHIGNTLSGGHYISMVRDAARSCWRKFDDEKVSDFDPSKLKGDRILQSAEAYLVFYGRAAAR